MDGFDLITNKVKQMYQMITLGGDAELEVNFCFLKIIIRTFSSSKLGL